MDIVKGDNRQATSTPTDPDAADTYGQRIGLDPVTQYLDIAPLADHGLATFTILDAQPGNNFIVATGHGATAINSVKISDVDGFTPLIGVAVGQQSTSFSPLPSSRYTSILEVWRTFWVERDSMRTPDPVTEGPFDQPQVMVNGVLVDDVFYDKFPGDIPDAVMDLVANAYYPANIEVKVVDGAVDVTDNTYFTHNIEANLQNAEIKALSVSDRSFQNVDAFWVGHLIGAYEGWVDRDFDDDNNALLGIAKADTNVAWIFHETIRDHSATRAAEPVVVGVPRHVGEAKSLQRTPLHETGHFFGLKDLYMPGDPLSVMNYFALDYLSDEYMRFTNSEMGRMQSQPKPTTIVKPQPPPMP